MDTNSNSTPDIESIRKLKQITDNVFNDLSLEINQLSEEVLKASEELSK